MLIPIRCFTCNNMIGDKWILYCKIVSEKKNISKENVSDDMDIEFIDNNAKIVKKSKEGEALDELGLNKYCCRRMILSNVHLISYI
jgi:DNA-directed RNA polymerase subunit N (RpoN/RPB10)